MFPELAQQYGAAIGHAKEPCKSDNVTQTIAKELVGPRSLRYIRAAKDCVAAATRPVEQVPWPVAAVVKMACNKQKESKRALLQQSSQSLSITISISI